MKQKIITLLNQLNHGLVEREETLKTALLTVLAGENIVLIGPPGTGKSMLARRIADGLAVDKGEYFEYLLTKFSTPEEIFGPLSITELKQDRFKRNTAGYLPTVKMAFLDEIFKASSSILNALLTILNERVYHNGAEPQKVPLRGLIAASNELPTDQEELSALYDRFLVRGFVDYVKPENLKKMFEKTGDSPDLSKLTAADLDQIQRNAQLVEIPEDVIDVILLIWEQHKETFKEDRRESLSDRRLKKVLHLLRVSAATNGRTEVDLSDVLLLKDCLWNHQDNAIKVRDLILKALRTLSARPRVQSKIMSMSDQENRALASAAVKGGITEKKQFITRPSTGQLNAVVKGFKGSGTQQDPLLIENFHELMNLSRPDVGLQGLYFRQTANIDYNKKLSAGKDISFKGNYDGGGYTIRTTSGDGGLSALFNIINTKSKITNIKLEGLMLANSAEASHITHCISSEYLMGKAANCNVTSCQAGNSLIKNKASACNIADCLVVGFWLNHTNECRGGIAGNINGGVVERCFVTGKSDNNYTGFTKFSGIAYICNSGTIRQCAVGELGLVSSDIRLARIVMEKKNTATLDNNISIDSNNGTDNANGVDGKTIKAALFQQSYFKNTLKWDFNEIWRWDKRNGRPALRELSISANAPHANTATQQNLLTQQISANIWLYQGPI